MKKISQKIFDVIDNILLKDYFAIISTRKDRLE